MAPPSSSQLKYLNMTKFQQAARHLNNILSINLPNTWEPIYSGQIKTHLQVLESEHQRLLERIKQLESKAGSTSTMPSKRPLASLPDLCLLALFRELPLADQITARHVCHRWHSLATEVTHSRRRLTLLVNHRRIDQLEDWINYPRYYSGGRSVVSAKAKVLSLLRSEDGRPLYPVRRYTAWNTLQFGSLSKEAAVLISGTFPGVKELQLAVNSAEMFNIEHLVSLLGHWRSQLTSLFLFNGVEDSHCSYNDKDCNPKLLSAINSLPALKCFTLYAYEVHYKTFDLPIIGQLEELNLRFYKSPSEPRIPAMLKKYGDGNKALARISLQYEVTADMELENFTTLSAHLRNCFTQLHCDIVHFQFLVPDLFMHFPNITTLHLRYPDHARNFDLSMITQLTQLIHLHLFLDFRSIRPADPPYLLQRQVKSVRALELVLCLYTHEQLPPMNIASTFPNVEAIHVAFSSSSSFYFSKCNHCEVKFFPDEARQKQANPAQVKHCLRQIFAPLKRDCTKLRAILHDREKVFGTADELLAQ